MDIYICKQGGQQEGPYSVDQIRQWISEGQLSSTDLGWHQGISNWLPLSAIQELSSPPPIPTSSSNTSDKNGDGITPEIKKKYQRNSSLGVGIGLILYVLGGFFASAYELNTLGGIVVLFGYILFVWGCYQYAKSKGYTWAFGFLGILTILGLIILVLLPDKTKRKN